MNKEAMMKIRSFALVGLLTLAPLAAKPIHLSFACCREGCFEAGAEALYWKPCVTPFQYASTGEASNLTQKFINPDYHWGFRIYGAYFTEDLCNFVKLGWVYLHTSDAGSVKGVINEGGASKAEASLKLRYNRVNLRGGHYFTRGKCLNTYIYAGARYIEIRDRRALKTTGTASGVVKENNISRFEAGGFEVGLGAEYNIGCGFNFTASVAPTVAIGSKRFNSLTQSDPHQTACVPGGDLRLGVNFAGCCCGTRLTAELGYEMQYYFDPYTLRPFDAPNLPFDTNAGFAGLYLSLGVRF